MAFEGVPQMDRSEEAMKAARELIAENELLRDNERVQALAENDFVAENGRELDPGNFLASMLDYIEAQEPGTISREDLTAAVERTLVEHSRPHETERGAEAADQSRDYTV